ncbi:MAG TPA: secondary thiamine-phosphate synthase enzyme YjbQ [Thermodesulfovibrionales bacterium]|nr:secondary thiamine-phosphate synthase enzyme YjbQ [Thermodesulfovibrionales bacterium]
MVKYINVKSRVRNEFIDITDKIQEVVKEEGVTSGICYIFVPHTTAGITINEGADTSVQRDIQVALSKLVPFDAEYSHREGNADAHIKSTLVGISRVVFVDDGKLLLGTWQAIYFCEFDGPRHRRVAVKIVKTVRAAS